MAIYNLNFFYLCFVFFWIHLLSNNNNRGRGVEAAVTGLRTGYHFQPPQNWINDPNGPMFYNGIYHLFYQYNPKGAVWGNIVWAHSVSTDLINWFPLDPAIYPSKPFDTKGCWSGSATILPGNKPAILYTGIDKDNRQISNIAFPKNLSDPFLREWVKPDYNPVMEPVHGINASSYRDPTTGWIGSDGYWNILVGNKKGSRGMALLYKSKDFIKWKLVPHPLHSVANIGMWECPDFFPVPLNGNKHGLDTSVGGSDVKHVFKVSLDATRFEYYTLGTYFPEKDRYVPDNASVDDTNGLRYDYGNFYASKSFFDAGKNRRILWGWANESDTVADDVSKGWAGIQAIPRVVWLDKSQKQLVQWPVKELETLRRNEVSFGRIPLRNGTYFKIEELTAGQADVEVTFRIPSLEKAEPFDPSWIDAQQLCGKKDASVHGGVGPFGLFTLASENLDEYTGVFFRIFKSKDKPVVLMCSGGIRSSLDEKIYKPSYGGFVDTDLSDGKIYLRSLIDNSVVESFGARGKTCITSRVYPTKAIGENAHLFVFNYGSESIKIANLKAWSMNKPYMN